MPDRDPFEPEVLPRFRNLDADAVSFRTAIQQANRLPHDFPEAHLLSLCAAAQDIARAEDAHQPTLLQALHEQLALMRETIPRDADDATGDPEYQRLRYALSELTAEAAARLLDVQTRPEPIDPDAPRLGPPTADAAEIQNTAGPLVQQGEKSIQQLQGAFGPNATYVEKSVVKIVFTGTASARLVGVAVDGLGTLAKRLGEIAALLRDLPGKLRSLLKGMGKALGFAWEDLEIFAETAKCLSALCMAYSNERDPQRASHLEDANDQLRLIESFLRSGDTEKAAAASRRLKSIPGHEEAEASFEMQIEYLENTEQAAILSSISSLRGLSISQSPLKEISFIGNLQNLESLVVGMSGLVDLSALSNCTNLRHLHLISSVATDISPISGLGRLESLTLVFKKLRDVTPLSTLIRLVDLDIENTGVRDVSALSNLPKLERLHLPDGVEDNRDPALRRD